MLTQSQADAIRARLDKENAWVDSIRGRNGWASYKPEDKPAHVPTATNKERSALEVFDFCQSPPAKYFAYVSTEKRQLTTWMGDTLGTIDFGREYRDNFGGRRVPIRVNAINGRQYVGTYYTSSGDYARIRLAK